VGLVNKNRICLKSYVKTEDFRGFQLVKYEKGYMPKQEEQDRTERVPGGQEDKSSQAEPGGEQDRTGQDKERKKQRKKERE
jgi:hypothetical protein